jgi:hypothetical protein
MLELRLARRFAKMSMSVGQANNSPSSDAVLVVEVVANGEQVDLRRVPFDQLQPFELDVQDVNALKIHVWIDPETCRSSKEVVAVVENLVLSG